MQYRMKCGKSTHLLTELKQGWVPLMAVFCSNFVILASQKTFPVLYVVLREKYQSSATETSWLSGLLTLLTKSLGPLSSLVIARFSLRPTAIVGVAILSIGTISSSFVKTLPLLYICYSTLIGCGSSLVYVASYLVVSNHFHKYKTFAYGIINVGYSLGIFTLPILCDILIDKYGLSGQFLIMGGLMLNGFVFVSLFRPQLKHDSTVNSIDKNIHTLQKEEDDFDQTMNSTKVSLHPTHNHMDVSDHMSNDGEDHALKGTVSMLKDNDRHSVYSGSHSHISQKSLEIIVNTSNVPNGIHKENGEPKQAEQDTEWDMKQSCSDVCCDSPFVYLLRNPSFSMFCFLTFCHHAALGIFYTFIKAFALIKGVEDHRATMLVSMSGLAEMCGNLVLPFLSDLPLIRNHKFPIYLAMCIGSGIMFNLFVICSNYGGLLSLVFVTVFMTSQLHTLRIPFAISMTGVTETNVVSALIGLITFCMGTGQGIGPMIGGLIIDKINNYDYPFIVAGAFFLGSGILFGLQHCISQTRARRQRSPSSSDL